MGEEGNKEESIVRFEVVEQISYKWSSNYTDLKNFIPLPLRIQDSPR